jgi:T5SS/PEP-CTERM-associated repeat protein
MFHHCAIYMRVCSRRVLSVGITLILAGVLISNEAPAALTYTLAGEVQPADPSTWTTSTHSYIGYYSGGTVTLTSGNLYSEYLDLGYATPSAYGLVTVSGTSSVWTIGNQFTAGFTGRGVVNVTNGGTITVASGFVAELPGSTGTVTVDGTGSTWTNRNDSYIGFGGTGTLKITNHATVNTGSSYIGYNRYPDSKAAGLATISGAGSAWTSNSIDIGYFGSGSLTITDGGSVGVSDVCIGTREDSSGTATVDGGSSTWTCKSLFVGKSGSGTINVSNGGAVAVDGTTFVGAGGSGMIRFGVGGGTLTTGSLAASATQLTGIGTINTSGLLTDANLANLTFDSAGSLKRTLTVPGQSIAINLDMSTNPSHNGVLGAGWRSNGSVTIKNGVTVISNGGELGYMSGSSGNATIDGVGSKWTNSGDLRIGYSGSGSLTITNGGSVSFSSGYMAYSAGSSGSAIVDGVGSVWTGSKALRVGYFGNGSLTIVNGGSVSNSSGYIAYYAGSSGSAMVDGVGSVWTGSGALSIGYSGSGSLTITNGGSVSYSSGYIGDRAGSSGTVTVDGAGSVWITSGTLSVGSNGTGTLSVMGEGAVTANRVAINSSSLLAVDVGRGSLVKVAGGIGTIANDGTVRVLAGAGVPVDNSIQYSPISAGAWGGTGTCQAVGGKWNSTTHMFTASSVTSGTSGSPVVLDLAMVERTLVDHISSDGGKWTVGASFVTAANTTNITFTATAIGDGLFDALQTAAGVNQEILSGWTFSTTVYTPSASNPIYLSLDVGADYPSSDLRVWHYEGTSWTRFTPTDLTYDGTYASFTVTGLGGYAVTAPEPSTIALLAIGVLGLLAHAWRRRRAT